MKYKRKVVLILSISSLLFSCNNNDDNKIDPPIVEETYATNIKLSTLENKKEIYVGDILNFVVSYDNDNAKKGVKFEISPTSAGKISENGVFTALKESLNVSVIATYKYDLKVKDVYNFKILKKEEPPKPIEVKLEEIEISDESTYYVGDTYNDLFKDNIKLIGLYSDKTRKEIDINECSQIGIDSLISPRDGKLYLRSSFNYSGKWGINFKLTYNNKDYELNYEINVYSALKKNYKIKEIKFLKTPHCYVGSLFNPINDLELEINYKEINVKEIINYSNSLGELEYYLYDKLDESTNVIDKIILKDHNYQLVIKDKDSNYIIKQDLETKTSKGYYKIEEPTIEADDISSSYSPHKGDVKVLIVPLEFVDEGDYYDTLKWNNNYLNNVNKYYFGTKEDTPNKRNSFKSYYDNASFNKLNIEGFVSDVYKITNYSISEVNEAPSMNLLFNVFNDAISFIKENHKEIDFSEFDNNNDGVFDNIHFISNAGNSIEWSENLWPHMYNANIIGTHASPGVDVYSLSSLAHFVDARTAIHEQGHMFGLDDYYDYSDYSTRDYIGGADMQSYNCFDWNSYSKFIMGWVNPYVIDGTLEETYITLNAASLNGDCLIIPANTQTFNNSAYDEYFLIELFSPFNNNKHDWDNYYKEILDTSYINGDLGEYGVRMYHVDSRLYSYKNSQFDGKDIENIDELRKAQKDNHNIIMGATNSYDSDAYAGESVKAYDDFKLLSLIQRGKKDTFGHSGQRNLLLNEDLFKEGDVFKFSEYSHFLSKDNKKVTTMDNGEIFPYTITFLEMNKEQVTIKVSK